jgi:ELWxxDGT repeat protein
MMTFNRTLSALILIAFASPQPSSALGGPLARQVREFDDGNPTLAGLVNGALLFFVRDEQYGRELWRSDGTPEGTELVRDILPGAEGAIFDSNSSVVFEDLLAFPAVDAEHNAQLWRSDGTEAGTVLVRDIDGGSAASPRLFTPVGDRLWFMAAANFGSDDQGSDDLWTTDLTAEGTTRLSQLGSWKPGFSFAFLSVASLTPFEDGALVARIDIFECCEETSLRRVDAQGRPANLPEDLLYERYVPGHSISLIPVEPLAGVHTAYFTSQGEGGSYDCKLWRTDGTVATQIDVGNIGCGMLPMAVLGENLLLARSDVNRHLRIHRATPSESALSPAADLGEVSVRPYDGWLATASTGLFFSVRSRDADELWHFENAKDPPALLRRFEVRGAEGLYLRQLTAVGSKVYFWAGKRDVGGGNSLWESSGSPESTRLVGILPTTGDPSGVVASDSQFFFWVYDASSRTALWTIDRPIETATPTSTQTPTATDTPTVTDTPTATQTPTSTKPPCVGDCSADGSVTVADVVDVIKVALGLSHLDTCPLVDANSDLRVSVDEIVVSVYSLLHDCPRQASPLN